MTRPHAPALAAVALVALLAGPVATASAREASAGEVRALAARAADDPAALAQLRAVDTVDGRPVALAAALAGARGPALRARLRVLARGARADRGASASVARAQAREVLAEGRFHQRLPQPFKRPLERLGDWLQRVWDRVPGGPGGSFLYALVAVTALAALLSLRGIRRRRAAADSAAGLAGAPGDRPPAGPAELERAADAAERDGDHARAVRLRFRAGLERLGERDAIPYRPSLTTAEARRRLHSAPFDRLADDFDAIAYGGRPAVGEDAEAARSGWRDVLTGTGAGTGAWPR